MPGRPRNHSLTRWLLTLGAILAFAAQLSVALAPFGEARYGSNAAAHVEAGGTATHYAHNDATCAVCQARLHQGFAHRASDPPLTVAVQPPAVVVAVQHFVAPEALSPSKPRAPPVG
jgi:hypothetical protein